MQRLEVSAVGCAVLVLLGCGGAGDPSPEPSADATSSGANAPASTTDPADDTSPVTGSDTGSVFLVNPDLGDGSECDYFIQDCASGLKCMPWSNDGGTWNAARCVPSKTRPGSTRRATWSARQPRASTTATSG